MYSQVCLTLTQCICCRVYCWHYRYKGVLKYPAWVKSKLHSTTQGKQVVKEDFTLSGEERVELMDIVATGQEGKDDYTTTIMSYFYVLYFRTSK